MTDQKMGRKVAVIVRHPPFNSDRDSEALRLSVGQTLAENEVTVVFLAEGVTLLREVTPALIEADDVGKHLRTCQDLGVRLVAEEEALRRHGIIPAAYVEVRDFLGVCALLSRADVVIPF